MGRRRTAATRVRADRTASRKSAPLDLKELETLYLDYNHPLHLAADPLGRVDPSLVPADFELVSFLVAGLSYGRVEQIRLATDRLLSSLHQAGAGPNGHGLAEFLRTRAPEDDTDLRRALKGWVHRLNTPADIVGVLDILTQTLRQDGSLCRAYQLAFVEDPALHFTAFVERLRSRGGPDLHKDPRARKWKGAGAAWFVPSPVDLGTCKRLLMWLRWMVRRDSIDPGTWQNAALIDANLPRPSPARLLWPVDTHVFKWARERGLVTRASPSWKSTLELTAAFQALNPQDPVRYDFAVCHAGMTEFRRKN